MEDLSKVHTFSKETIYHFRCGSCTKWWSIADFSPEGISPMDTSSKLIVCPLCGTARPCIEFNYPSCVEH